MTLWVEKFRPKTLDEYVFTDESQRAQVEAWVKAKQIPHLLFSGGPGTGKTTLAKVLINELGVNGLDFMEINASRVRKVEEVQDKIINFSATMPFGDCKYILLDEADFLSQTSQAFLRGTMETYAETCRFILTCNYPHKIIPALHSRCQGFKINKPDITEFTARVAKVLIEENIDFELDVLENYVRATYPDLRKTLNSIQPQCLGGKLEMAASSENTDDWQPKLVELFKQGKFYDARKLVAGKLTADEFQEQLTWMYNNLDLWSKTPQGQDQALLIIRDALVKHTQIAESEINFAACCVQLSQIAD